MTFEIVFRYISVHCDMQLTFFDLRMDGKKGQSDDAPKKLNGKVCDLPDRISSVLNVPLSNINMDGYICNERSYRDLKRLEKILEDVKISPTTIIERRVHNKQPNKTLRSFGL